MQVLPWPRSRSIHIPSLVGEEKVWSWCTLGANLGAAWEQTSLGVSQIKTPTRGEFAAQCSLNVAKRVSRGWWENKFHICGSIKVRQVRSVVCHFFWRRLFGTNWQSMPTPPGTLGLLITKIFKHNIFLFGTNFRDKFLGQLFGTNWQSMLTPPGTLGPLITKIFKHNIYRFLRSNLYILCFFCDTFYS